MQRACSIGGFLLLVVVVAGCSDNERRSAGGYASTSQTDTTASNELGEMSLEEITEINFSSGRGMISLEEGGSDDSYLLVVSASNTT
ncbi:MAG: hypothetical protein HYW02_02125 [Deltaproteobacteria bacterium]|nr:hypothetical protein [Deltaproteobacteria bacterium]